MSFSVGKRLQDFLAPILEAAAWLKPRLADVDAVFVTTTRLNMPYVVMLVALQYDPQQWFGAPRETQVGPWEYYTRIGKLWFDYRGSNRREIHALEANARHDHIVVIARPGEFTGQKPVVTIQSPDGKAVLLIYEMQL